MSLTALLIGVAVGAVIINFLVDHWDFEGFLLGTVGTAIVGGLIVTGLWWVFNNVDPETATAAEAVVVEELSAEEEPPSQEEVPRPQYDFGEGLFE